MRPDGPTLDPDVIYVYCDACNAGTTVEHVPTPPNGKTCPICGKELVPDERTYPWGTMITIYECPDRCALAADDYSPDEVERMRQLADGFNVD